VPNIIKAIFLAEISFVLKLRTASKLFATSLLKTFVAELWSYAFAFSTFVFIFASVTPANKAYSVVPFF
jgi:hypothetical protein